MVKLVKITAKEGMRIRIPEQNYRVLPKEGATVRWGMYWAKAKERGEIDVADVEVSAEQQKAADKAGKNPEVSAEVKTPGMAVS